MSEVSRLALLVVVAVTIGFRVWTSAASGEEKEPREVYEFYSTVFPREDMPAPPCTPLRADVFEWKEETRLADPNLAWGEMTVSLEVWRSARKHSTFAECLAEAPVYQGRYTKEQVAAFSKGELVAGMPLEFALMVLGPPDQRPSMVSMLNPVTGKPETLRSYMWMKIGRMSGLRVFLGVIGTLALGVGGVSSDLGTMTKSLEVATAATAAEALTWQLADFSGARVVLVQTKGDNTINMLSVN